MGRFRFWAAGGFFFGGVALLVMLMLGAGQAGADHSDPAVIEALDGDGRYLESNAGGLDAAIDRANQDGIAFAWLARSGSETEATTLAGNYLDDLFEAGSRYSTVVVLLDNGYGADSTVSSQASVERALDAALDGFSAREPARGLDAFTESVSGTSTSGDGALSDSSGGGIGFGTILLVIAVLGGGFLLFRRWSNGRKAERQAEIDLEDDRAEIKEQLKNNADRVISLGDRVIAKADDELIALYEEASQTYQAVNLAVDGAETAAEIDELDDRIDHAEWQFEVIEARLDNLTVPPSPAERAAAAEAAEREAQAEARRSEREAQGRAGGSGLPPGPGSEPPVVTSPRTGRSYPRSRRRRGGMGGGLGGLGGVLGSIVLGGGIPGMSRRTQRRSGSSGGLGGPFGGSGAGSRSAGQRRSSPGGGVFGRSGSGSRSRRSSGGRSIGGSSGRSRRTRPRASGGRSFGRRR